MINDYFQSVPDQNTSFRRLAMCAVFMPKFRCINGARMSRVSCLEGPIPGGRTYRLLPADFKKITRNYDDNVFSYVQPGWLRHAASELTCRTSTIH